jgi:26S proteasome regulatory subunit N5
MEILLDREREARQTKNHVLMREVMQDIINQCKNDEEILTMVKLLGKRKGQLKDSFRWLINHVFSLKREMYQSQDELLISFCVILLKDVVEGKMYLEEERVEISTLVKELYEHNGDISKALESVFSVPVETFSSLSERRVIVYQLEILRLCIACNDWTRSDIIGKRIRKRYFKENQDKELEVTYYYYMVKVCLGQENFLEASRIYQLLIDEKEQNVILGSFFSILSASKEDMSIYLENKNNNERMRRVLKMFISKEIIGKDEVFDMMWNVIPGIDEYRKWVVRSVDEHNFEVIGLFFSVINMNDLGMILQCGEDECVEIICSMVNKGTVKCKIDQGRGVLTFTKAEGEGVEIGDVLDKIMKANHLIHKENLKYSIEDQ